MFTKSDILKRCIDSYGNPNGISGMFAKKNPKTRAQIPSIIEFYTLLESVLIDEDSLFITGNPVYHNFKQGIYFLNERMIVCLDIEPNTLQYLTFWTTGILRESCHFTNCSGSFLFTFDFHGEYFIPNIYSYFVIDKTLDEIVPILSLNYLEEHRESLDFVTDGLAYLSDTFNFKVNMDKIKNNVI